jgi:hypothetical protein
MLLQKNTFKNSKTFSWGSSIIRGFSLFVQYGEPKSRRREGGGGDCIFQVIHNEIMQDKFGIKQQNSLLY